MCTTTSLALSKDDFLEFLINSSYPESQNVDKSKEENTKKTDPKDDSKEGTADKSPASKNSNTDSQDKSGEYVQVYVGEDKIPTVDSEQPVSVDNSAKGDQGYVPTSEYKNEVRITSKQPNILIYHTHSGETYSDAPAGNYHSKDTAHSVMEVGSVLTDSLADKGWGVIHSTKYHDIPSFNSSYSSSLKTINKYLNEYKSIDIAMDIHRDGKDTSSQAAKDKAHSDGTTVVNGKRIAKFCLVVGGKNTNTAELRKLAEGIYKVSDSKYPGLTTPIVQKDYARFNEFAAKNHILVEIGSNGTTTEEAKATAKYVADILDTYFRQAGQTPTVSQQ
jgi:stage II sporulation protein P